MYIISVFILMLQSGFCYKSLEAHQPIQTLQTQNEVLPGSDVSLRCDVSLLSESSTLKWEKQGQQTSNTTLIYNNSAYIILHTVSEGSQGEYYCRLMEDGKAEIVQIHTLSVKTNSHNRNIKTNTIYRQSSTNSEVSLICKSRKRYENWKWTWEPRSSTQIDLIAVEKRGEVQVKGPIKSGRRSSSTYDNQSFIFHILPMNFNYSGTYRCITETGTYTTTILHTIRVSVEPSDGVLRNQSVLLTCEISEVTDSVTLVWLRIEGNRGILGKQQIMAMNNNKLQLTVDVSSNEIDPLHWQCAVFTKNTLRALAPITISLNSSISDQAEDTVTHDSHLQIVIIVAFVVTVSVLILLGLLVFKCQQSTADEGHINESKSQEEDIHYASVTVAGSSERSDRIKTNHASSEVSDGNSTVIYSAIKTK